VGYRAIAGAIVGVHFAFIGYVIVGGFIALRWRKTIWAHLAACAWAVAILTVPRLLCPLTIAQNWAREHAGLAPYAGGFIDHYVENAIYPARFTPIVQTIVGLTVIGSWIWFGVRRQRPATAPQM